MLSVAKESFKLHEKYSDNLKILKTQFQKIYEAKTDKIKREIMI